ncbi:hypothetical protein [Spirosoma luteum]|uniref:hypothetical protein n=1 Tax=Spirosoma luteum TaxID=431553 RepID=UPI0003817BC8|nr:hypothetical protein [Spirosoma luteum]
MKFFVPFTVGRLQAEETYDLSKRRLEEIGFRVNDVRIEQLLYLKEGELINQQVGDGAPNGEIIAAILHSDVGYFVCTFTSADEPTKAIPIRYTQLITDASIVAVRYFDY